MKNPFGLYLVITDPATSYETCAEAAVRANLRFVQLRMKNVSREYFLSTAKNLRAITAGTQTLFIVNDSPEIAAEVGADGVHLGQ
ncbi:MAG: thiamine phosphate synthase [Opitutales bacterium]|nr:thiamine phosphate synthase [Opitutales bacterium]